MTLAVALALQAGSATLAWDYDFGSSPDVNLFKVYCAPGTNATWLANNSNATKIVDVPYTGSGVVSNITFMVGGMSSGAWTFTVTAIGTGGLESENATTLGGTNLWGVIKPSRPVQIHIVIP